MTTTSNPRVTDIRRKVRASYDALNTLLDGPIASIDTAQIYRSPGSNEWTIMENLAHIVEFLPYWGQEITHLLAHPGAKFGRTQQDAARLQAIAEHGQDSIAQARAALPGSYESLDRALASLQDSDLELTGLHPKFGEHTIDWFIKDFIVKHFADHVEQIKGCFS